MISLPGAVDLVSLYELSTCPTVGAACAAAAADDDDAAIGRAGGTCVVCVGESRASWQVVAHYPISRKGLGADSTGHAATATAPPRATSTRPLGRRGTPYADSRALAEQVCSASKQRLLQARGSQPRPGRCPGTPSKGIEATLPLLRGGAQCPAPFGLLRQA